MNIRKATVDDAVLIAPLFDAYRVFYEESSDLDAAMDFIKTNLSHDRSSIFIYEDEGPITGFTQVYPALCSVAMKPFYVLYDLYVVPQARGKGVVTALLEFAHQWSREQ